MCDKFYGVANGKQFVKAILVILGSLKHFLVNITKAHSTIAPPPPPLLNLLRLQGQIIDVKCKNNNKSDIYIFFQPLLNLSKKLVISNMHKKFGKDTRKTFHVITPTRSNY